MKRAIEQWASNKAAGEDYIPGGFYKDKANRKIIIERLEKHFKEYIQTTEISNYFMEAKLILISKDNTEYPIIEETRPISILPTVTKIFELSILHHLEKATQTALFWRNQRGLFRSNHYPPLVGGRRGSD